MVAFVLNDTGVEAPGLALHRFAVGVQNFNFCVNGRTTSRRQSFNDQTLTGFRVKLKEVNVIENIRARF